MKAKLDAKLRTPICDLFGIDYPIIQTGMGWVSGAKLTSATSAAGGLGILAAATMTFEELEQAIQQVKDNTDRNFGVNLRADQADVMKRVELLISAQVKVASFAQAPGKAVITRLKDAGVLTMPTIGAQRHAQKVAEWGVDSVIAQGHEGGGHTGNVPTHILMRQVADVVSFPFLGAGGFSDGRGLVSAMASGASGIAMGTRFLLTQESQVPEHVKAQYLKTAIDGTVVTRAIDGYPQRVIRTPMIDELEQASPFTRFPKAARNALTLMKLTNTKLMDMIEEGRAMKESKGAHLVAAGHGRQRADAHQGEHGRRQGLGHPAHRSGGGCHRRAAHRGPAARAHHGRGEGHAALAAGGVTP
jgi:NAD(P)H-dependent flavin oxidoreductase YrpB (nitropropane dioxygenase family)